MEQNVLSQAAIDAMLENSAQEADEDQEPDENREAVKTASSRSTSKEKSAGQQAPASDGASISSLVAKLTERVTRVEVIVENVKQLEKAMSETGATVRQGQEGLQAIIERLRGVDGKVADILTQVQGTLGYGARGTFTCSSCASHGLVAIRVRCTQCAQEVWWGWWPKK